MGIISKSIVEEIRSRVRISEIIGKYVQLKHKAGGEYQGLCPFHSEKTPSFTVSDNKEFYHCFGCSEHGSAIDFLMKLEGWSYPETVKYLADKAGVAIIEEEYQRKERNDNSPSLYDVSELACKYFHYMLSQPAGKEALSYLRNRNITNEDIKYFRIGYAPDGFNNLLPALQSADSRITEKMLLDAGILIRNDNGKIYDRFRDRVMFPITNFKQQVIAFGGRILGEGNPKYLNSPETPIFRKGEIVYSSPNTRKAIYQNNSVIVAEGYMDVIALHKAGIDYAVAPLGTAITEGHLSILWNMAKEPIICLDGDNAGQKAMIRLANLAFIKLTSGYSVSFAKLPYGQDPDDILRKKGKAELLKLLANTIPLSEVIWDSEVSQYAKLTPENIAGIKKNLEHKTSQIPDGDVSMFYNNFFKNKLWDLQRHNKHSYKRSNTTNNNQELDFHLSLKAGSHDNKVSHSKIIVQQLLALIVTYPDLLNKIEVAEDLHRIEFANSKYQQVIQLIDELITTEEEINKENLYQALEINNLHTYIEEFGAYIKELHILDDVFQQWEVFMGKYDLARLEDEQEQIILQIENNIEDEEKILQLQSRQKAIAEAIMEARNNIYDM